MRATYINTYIHTGIGGFWSPRTRYPAWTKKCVQTLVSVSVLKHSGELTRNMIFRPSRSLLEEVYVCLRPLSMYVRLRSPSVYVCMYVCLRQLSMYVCMYVSNIHTYIHTYTLMSQTYIHTLSYFSVKSSLQRAWICAKTLSLSWKRNIHTCLIFLEIHVFGGF